MSCHRKTIAVFLLDEPLANLDAQLRQHARQELIKSMKAVTLL